MARARKSWREKLEDAKGLPAIVRPKGKGALHLGERMLVPAPKDVDALMKKVRKGRVTTVGKLRDKLAEAHEADSTCPLTTGIFVGLAARAAQEAEDEGKKRVTPWWRTLKARGELNPKYPGGLEEQARRLAAEGHVIVKRGKRWFVEAVYARYS
jgi:alkylated DNA nucleotide flippase Atl1